MIQKFYIKEQISLYYESLKFVDQIKDYRKTARR